jgi:hypothetical protein
MNRKAVINLLSIVLVILYLTGLASCRNKDETSNSNTNFNFVFKYGVNEKNKLDTFHGTYTRDMVLDPSITVHLSLTHDELGQIINKMEEISFFSYPDIFVISVSPGEMIQHVTPYSSYYFKVEYGSIVKELQWEAEVINKEEKADKLRELINLIQSIIEAKDEYKSLPEPKGGYF